MGIPLLGTAAKAVLSKVGPTIAKAIGGIFSKGTAKAVGSAVVTAGAAAAGAKVVKKGSVESTPPYIDDMPPPLGAPLPQYESQYPAVTGPVSPGGTPISYGGYNGRGSLAAMGVLSGQIPLTAVPQLVAREVAPPGYVLIRMPDGRRLAMLKEVAYAVGLKKRPRKSQAISSRDVQAAKRVQNFIQQHSVARKPKLQLKKGRR